MAKMHAFEADRHVVLRIPSCDLSVRLIAHIFAKRSTTIYVSVYLHSLPIVRSSTALTVLDFLSFDGDPAGYVWLG